MALDAYQLQRLIDAVAAQGGGAAPELTLLASAARTATTNTADQSSGGARGVLLVLDVTVASGTGGLVVRIQVKDPASGKYQSINAAPTAIIAVGTTAYLLYPAASAGSGNYGQVGAGALPRTWRVSVTHADGSSYTYSLGAGLIP